MIGWFLMMWLLWIAAALREIGMVLVALAGTLLVWAVYRVYRVPERPLEQSVLRPVLFALPLTLAAVPAGVSLHHYLARGLRAYACRDIGFTFHAPAGPVRGIYAEGSLSPFDFPERGCGSGTCMALVKALDFVEMRVTDPAPNQMVPGPGLWRVTAHPPAVCESPLRPPATTSRRPRSTAISAPPKRAFST